jgi:pseudouridine kinase
MKEYVSVIGGINLDLKGLPHGRLRPETSNPGHIAISVGGVGRNIAHNLALLGVPVLLFGAVGEDVFGARVLSDTQAAGVNVQGVQVVPRHATGIYLAILNEAHDLAVALSDMDITRLVDMAYLDAHRDTLRQSRLIVADTNLETTVLHAIVALCCQAEIPCLINPVSVEKTQKLAALPRDIAYITPNKMELEALCHHPIAHLEQLETVCAQLSPQYRHILVTLGADGVYSYRQQAGTGMRYPALPTQVLDPNGAGDAFIAGFVSGVVRDFDVDTSVCLGIAAAHLTLQSPDTVNKDLSFERCQRLSQA